MKDVYTYILSDYTRYSGGGKPPIFKLLLEVIIAKNHCFTYSFWLRLASMPNPFNLFACYMHRRLSRKWGIQIPRTAKIGYGLYIGHGVGIVINPNTVIGNNVNLSQFLTIGSNKGTPAVIGDNVYIGPSVCIVEDVKIGNNVTIGAGSVVTKDVPENATVAGVPAKVLNYNNPGRFVNRRWNP